MGYKGPTKFIFKGKRLSKLFNNMILCKIDKPKYNLYK